ncbi:hypothetical protein [Streptantibioticus ferralitis]|uniref:Uncharacterized protein n=1 Tax=Streptantibioticus ferralitis TaxID=236510 RepID=A0ABT5ZAK6_9ACTN|nr:hypothetical protein [Streptantibioticus ferralitis]MDF2260875.1 hypothetical protein [Streptantibioticus ferralitis]
MPRAVAGEVVATSPVSAEKPTRVVSVTARVSRRLLRSSAKVSPSLLVVDWLELP